MTSGLVTGIKGADPNYFIRILPARTQEKAVLMSKSCLIAAHDPWLIQLLRIFAHGSGFQIVQAFEGQEVLPLARQTLPVVILLQMDLAGQLRGWDVPRELNTSPDTRKIPILAFSWSGQASNDEPGNDSVTYIQEPVTYEMFVDVLRKLGIICPEKPDTLESPPQ